MVTRLRLVSFGGGFSTMAAYFYQTQPPRQSTSSVLPESFPRSCCCDATLFSHQPSSCAPATSPIITTSITNQRRTNFTNITPVANTTASSPPRVHANANQNSYFSTNLVEKLRSIVGSNNVYAQGDSQQNVYLKGARLGQGTALAVCRPGTLQEAVDSLRAIVEADAIVIPQGANTGLTGGSVPRDDTNRTAVVLNMRRLNKIIKINETNAASTATNKHNYQMLCHAGVGIHDLSMEAASIQRESHSILGSTFLNPSVAAGVSLGSGGSQMRKGPVFTERALWAKVTKDGQVQVYNTTGFDAPTEEELLEMIDSGNLASTSSSSSSSSTTSASFSPGLSSDAKRYCQSLCTINDGKVSRCNADTRGIDPVRSEGKVLILASVHETFPVPESTRNVWVSCNSLQTAQLFKQQVLLVAPSDLPISCEYMNRDTMNVVDQGGRALCHTLLRFGIGPHFEKMWDLKINIESIQMFSSFFSTLPDTFLSMINNVFPSILPQAMIELSGQYNHHMLIKVGDFGHDEIEHFEERMQVFLNKYKGNDALPCVAVHALNENEAKRVGVFRFAAAPAFRTWCVGRQLQGVSIDYSLPKNHTTLPSVNGSNKESDAVVRCRYSHFGCNVVHEDVAWKAGVDVEERKMKIKKLVEKEGGSLPAEHGHGTEYVAPTETRQRWMKMDPRNVLNPGVGGLSNRLFYENNDDE